MADPVTNYLNEVRERYNAGADYPLAGNVQAITDSSDDVPRLVAALDAVLELARPGPIYVNDEADWDWTLDPAAVRETIARTLLAEGSTDG